MIPVLFDLDEKDVVKWILVFLFKRRFVLSRLTLEKESGVTNSENFLTDLRQVIVEGDWKTADELILSLRLDDMDCRRIRFLLKRQQVFECFQRWKKCKDVETNSIEMHQCVQKENGCIEQDEGMQNGMQWCVEQKGFIEKQNGYLEPRQLNAKECCNIYNIALHHYSELKELKSGDDDFPDLSELLDVDCNAEDSNPLNGRILCFSTIYPLVCKAFTARTDKMSDESDDRLIELLVKGCFFESFEKYFHSKANCEELYANNGPRTMNLTQSSNVTVVSRVAKLLSDVDASLPLKFTAETVELNVNIRKLEKAPTCSDMTHLDNSFQTKRVTAMPTTKSLLQSSISNASYATQVCNVDLNEKTKYKRQEESSLLLDCILQVSKPEVVGDSGCDNLESVSYSVMTRRNSESDIQDSDVGNGFIEGLMDVNSTLAPEVMEVSNNCESTDNNKRDNTEENSETEVDLLNDEFQANPSSARTEICVFRHRCHCCEFCGKLIRSSSEMLRHVRTHRPGANRLVRKCHQCLRLFADESSFELHMSLHDEPMNCSVCQRAFVERVKLEQHVMKNHTTREDLSCIPCNERFSTQTELVIHMKQRHLENNVLSKSRGVEGGTRAKRGEFACDLCGKRFTGSGTLRKHIQSHTRERPHGCTTCGKKFLRLEHLQLHERIHTGEKPFRCQLCDYSSRQQNGLKTHMKQHSADNPYSCPGCGKQFSLLCRLKTHLLDATDKSDYSCPICLVEFHYACALKDHAKTHASKPFACDVCCRKFSRKHDMVLHAMLHSNAKPYVCGICKRGFSSKSYAKEHLSSHIDDDQCCCNACNREFKDSTELLSHMEQHIEGDWLKCRRCERTLGNGVEFREHQKQCCAKNSSGCKRGKPLRKLNCEGEKKSYQCSDCDYVTSVRSRCYRHRKLCEKKMEKVKIMS